MQAVVFNDIHEYGPHEMKVRWEYGPNAFYLGDNVDLRNCHIEDVPKAKKRLAFLSEKFGDRYIGGNHELNEVKSPLFKKVGVTLLTHGDVLFWGERASREYRTGQSVGASWIKRFTCMGQWDFLRHIKQPIFTQHFLDSAWAFAKLYGCKMVICGHRHPSHAVRREYNGVNIVVLPRGRNVIDLEME